MGKTEHFSFCFSTARGMRSSWSKPQADNNEQVGWRVSALEEKRRKREAFKKIGILMTNNNQLTAPSNHLHRRFIQGQEGHRSVNLFILHVPCYQLVRCFISLSNWILVCVCVPYKLHLFRQATLFSTLNLWTLSGKSKHGWKFELHSHVQCFCKLFFFLNPSFQLAVFTSCSFHVPHLCL